MLALVPGLATTTLTPEETCCLSKGVEVPDGSSVTQEGCESAHLGRGAAGSEGASEREDGDMQAEGCHVH